MVTYGFSHVLSPADFRDGTRHEYSIAVPANVDPTPWADALLRHLSRYVLSTGRDLEPGQVMPCYAPITYVPFQPDDHASMPATDLVGLVVAPDPVLSSVSTPNGDIEIRRFLGVHQAELDRAETWSATAFAEEYRQRDPLLLTDLDRADAMDDAAFRTRVDERAEQEGSEMPSLLLDVYWQDSATELAIEFPGGRQAQKLLDALHGRLSFGEPLTVIARQCPPIHFVPDASFDINWSPQGLVLQGTLDDPNIAEIVKFIRPDAPGAVVRLPLA